MTARAAAAAALALVLLLAGGAARAQDGAEAEPAAPAQPRRQWGRGPLEVRDPFILALSRLSPWARSPEVLAPKQVELGVRGVWANSYGFADDRYVLDAEVRQLWFHARVGVVERVELGVTLPYEWRGDGVMDGFIEGFHELFGLPDMQRDRRKRDQFGVAGIEQDGSVFSLEHEDAGLSDLILEPRALLLEGGDRLPALTFTLRLRLPTGRRTLETSRSVDVSLALDASKRLGDLPLIVYATLAWTAYGDDEVDRLELEAHRVFFAVGVEWEITAWLSLVTHFWIESPRETELYEDPPRVAGVGQADPPYGNHVTYIAAGFRAEPWPGLLVDVGMLENVIDPEVTSDFALLGNVAYRF